MMVKFSDIDLEYNHEIICPYCGCEQMDSWEFINDKTDGDSGEWDCDSCEKEFTVTLNVNVTYSSKK